MKIIYRISDTGYKKEKPDYINNESCLRNFCNTVILSKINKTLKETNSNQVNYISISKLTCLELFINSLMFCRELPKTKSLLINLNSSNLLIFCKI